MIGYYVILPLIGAHLSGVRVAMLVFGLNSGAYVSEIMRAGIQSVDSGQMEAGRALGLCFATTMRKIVIPQAIKNILPTLGNDLYRYRTIDHTRNQIIGKEPEKK